MTASYTPRPFHPTCITNAWEGLLHAMTSYLDIEWMCGGVAHSFVQLWGGFLNFKNVAKTVRC